MNKFQKNILISIISLGFLLRVFNLNWDSGYMFHPDERAIIMTTINLSYPSNLDVFFTIESPLNPKFFAYGNLPIYLLKIFSDISGNFNNIFLQYGGMHIVGRAINAIVGTFTIFIVFLIAKRLFNNTTGLIAGFIYAIAVFPIQNSHFYTVDTLLTFFLMISILIIDIYYKKPSAKLAAFLGISFGSALATKISALPFILVIALTFVISLLKEKGHITTNLIIRRLIDISCFTIFLIIIFFITQPYVLIDFKNFIEQITTQSKMGNDPFIFPYTLQYVGKIPLLYETKNILFWGLGIPISILAFAGIIYITSKMLLNPRKELRKIPIITFFWITFLLTSSYAVGWMRYLLPIYPILAISSAITVNGFVRWIKKNSNDRVSRIALVLILIICSIWTFAFMNIYFHKNTRVEATEWIINNIEPSKTIAIEHWDDALPIKNAQNYNVIQLPLYDNDTLEKWTKINNDLLNTDYIIIASNRLYTPLQKLTDCANLPQDKCYTKTSIYYKNLFSENLNFKKVIEFSNSPKIPFLNININDISADESFTVYDHPKIMIYEKK